MLEPAARPRAKVLVAMSGGVDSSIAAALLLRAGYEVVGCFMRLGSTGEHLDELSPDDGSCATGRAGAGASAAASGSPRIHHQGCCSINDAADARLVAAKLSIPFYVCNFKRDFGRIIDYFVGEYNAGRTPNPCVRCNDWLKFGKLHEYARQIGADFVASGHYARIDLADADRPRLRRGVDHRKDQSYVLFGTPRTRLSEMLLPIGDLEKTAVRALARDLDLPVFDKPDSQEICFVPGGDYGDLIEQRSPGSTSPGRVVDRAGRELGRHRGHQHYTVGQRRGVGVALGRPLYVVEKDPRTNTVTLGMKEDLLAQGCIAAESNWLRDAPPFGEWLPSHVKIRYNAAPVPGHVRAIGDSSIEVRFDDPQEAVAPGQAVVCYEGDAVACGGWIERATPFSA